MTLENEPTTAPTTTGTPAPTAPDGADAGAPPRRRRAARRPAGPPAAEAPTTAEAPQAAVTPDQPPVAVKATRKRAARKTAAAPTTSDDASTATTPTLDLEGQDAPVPAKKATRKRASKKSAAAEPAASEPAATEPAATAPTGSAPAAAASPAAPEPTAGPGPAPATSLRFQAPEPTPRRRRAASRPAGPPQHEDPAPEPDASASPPTRAPRARGAAPAQETPEPAAPTTPAERDSGAGDSDTKDSDTKDSDTRGSGARDSDTRGGDDGDSEDDEQGDGRRRRRRRGGRGRRKRGAEDGGDGQQDGTEDTPDADEQAAGVEPGPDDDSGEGDDAGEESASSRRRRRRRRRGGGDGDTGDDGRPGPDDPPNTVVKVRQPRKASDEVTSLKGSTRLEAKRQRRREGRDQGRRRTVITEAEFLARRESVERTMVVREREGRTQIAVLEDGVLVEHYVARKSQASMIGNVYLGKVQNVLPSMEAAFVDVGKGRNAVLYAGEVNWDAAGMEGQPKRIELALKSGDPVLVQVTKDPVGQKGARLTSQVSLPGRYLVYVPGSSMTGISRKLPDTERARLKAILKQVVPDDSGVIVRTAAEGASEEELGRDVARLQAQWAEIEKRVGAVNPPTMLHGEPDLTIKVVRDVFNEDFAKLVVSGDEAWETVEPYVDQVAPDLADRVERWTADDDVFAAHRIDEQIAKALERKVFLPSGGSLVIDRTEAMTVVDVNTGKFTGSGGNLEETVTRNNLEAAEEIVRQLRLRDVGGIIVIDFIDMVLESNRDLVLRRLLECLGRDRTKHQVAEVTSLGLVQMTRKRVGQGLLEAFSEPCPHCGGSGVVLHDEPVITGEAASGGSSKEQPPRKGGAKDVAAATARKAQKKGRTSDGTPDAAADPTTDGTPDPAPSEQPTDRHEPAQQPV